MEPSPEIKPEESDPSKELIINTLIIAGVIGGVVLAQGFGILPYGS